MRKVILMFVAIFSLVACQKDKEESEYSQKDLEGTWKIYDIIRPDGKSMKDFTGIVEKIENCKKEHSFFAFGGNNFAMRVQIPVMFNGSVDCYARGLSPIVVMKYSIKGITIRGTIDGETRDIYDILSLKGDRMAVKISEDMIKQILKDFPNYGFQIVGDYSLRESLGSKMILVRQEEEF